MSRILVVDDKELMRDSVATTLARKGHTVTAASSGKMALAKMAERQPDVIITDLQMPEMSGLDLLEEIRKFDEQLPVIFMTAFGTVETAVAAMKKGAFDYITKPFSGDELVMAAERAMEHGRLVKENQILKASSSSSGSGSDEGKHAMIGEGPAMKGLRSTMSRLADSHGTVLISGESGVGKEIAARWVHGHSPRSTMPFLAINCAALSTNLLESELFGHEKGAFTGADRLRKGRFELADGGTLLLDEISEISPEIQAKLLRVLQERAFERVGSSSSRTVDVRVVATTNRDLPECVSRGTFRQDLYYRLNVLPLHLPPLRERLDDVPELVTHFLSRVARREGRPVMSVSPEAMRLLCEYPWPGNVRELQNICERAAVLMAGSACIEAPLIAPWLVATGVPKPESPSGRGPALIEVMPSAGDIVCDGSMTLEEIERRTILATLQVHKGHRVRSAKALGIGVRTLGLKLKRWKELSIVAESV
jgi:two-component system, NtrC family, response regulator HydG